MITQGGIHLDRDTASRVTLLPTGNLSAMEFAVFVGREATVKNGVGIRIRLLPQNQNKQML